MEALGGEKINFGNSKKAPGRIPKSFFKKKTKSCHTRRGGGLPPGKEGEVCLGKLLQFFESCVASRFLVFWKFVGGVRGWKNVQKIAGGRPPEVEEGLESVAWRRQKVNQKWRRKSFQNSPRRLRNPPKMAPGALPGRSWEPLGPSGARGLKKPNYFEPAWGVPGASGGEKKFTGFCRGGSRKVLGPFFSVLSPPRSDFGIHFGSPGSSRGIILEVNC